MADFYDLDRELKPPVRYFRYVPEILFDKTFFELDLRNYEKVSTISRESELMKGVIDGNLNEIHRLLTAGVSADAEEYNRALFYASKNYMTPLHVAVALGHNDCVHKLIQYHANVNAKDKYAVTALHLAAQEGHIVCLKALLDAGADSNAGTTYPRVGGYFAIPFLRGTTPLHLAAANNRVECAIELIQYGADYNAVDEDGRTGLFIAAQLGYSDCVLAQIRSAVSYDILSLPDLLKGDTPLHCAVRCGMIECVKELVHLGSDVSHRNRSGLSPLHLAASTSNRDFQKSFEMLKLLVIHGYNCDVNQKNYQNHTALHYATFGVGLEYRTRPVMAAFLIAHGADINITDHRGVSLLEYEYNSPDNEPSIFLALVLSMNIPPHVNNIRNFYDDYLHLLGSIAPLYATFLTYRRRNHPNEEALCLPLHPSLQQKREWYSSIATNPRPLMHLCRYAIRKAVQPTRFRRIQELPLPNSLLSFMFFETVAFPH